MLTEDENEDIIKQHQESTDRNCEVKNGDRNRGRLDDNVKRPQHFFNTGIDEDTETPCDNEECQFSYDGRPFCRKELS